MKRLVSIAFSLGLLAVAACAINEPNPPAGKGNQASDGNNPVVVMETSMGTVKMELFQNKAPITVANFLRYVDDKHFDGTLFHRVIPGFMIQGGGFTPGLIEKGSKYPQIKNEAGNGVSNLRGTIAMARTGDPHSATDQFFINVVDNRKLDRGGEIDPEWGYAVFGQVTEGMDVVDKIKYVRTDIRKGQKDVPVEDVVIKSIRRVEAK
jgi:cyclophilin family peptidyl-prolyl cis-trans isomerase